MKTRARGILIVLAAVWVWGGCGQQEARDGKKIPASSETGPEVVATVDGVSISADDLDAAAKGQLQKLRLQVYQAKKRALDGLVEEKLIAKAAKEKGMTEKAYLAENVDAKVTPPTDEEVKAFYDRQKGRIKASFDQMKGRIADYLTEMKKRNQRRKLVASLRKNADVKIRLEPPRTEVSLDGAAYTDGDKDAKIVLVEFSDYECPFSKRAQATVDRIRDEYKGKIYYVFFDYPLPFHQHSKEAHIAARCAGEQGKYPEYGDKLFENQKAHGAEDLKRYARDLHLDMKAFNACLDAGKTAAAVQQSADKGARLGVAGTPAFFIDGIMVSGAQPYESFKEILDAELAR